MVEAWKPIPRTDGYEASSSGNVRSVLRTLSDGRRAGGVVLKQQPDKDGYPTVRIQGRRVRVSIAVQLAFAGPPEVRHLDGDRTNNRADNLEWGSHWRNEQDKKELRERGKRGIDGKGEMGTTLPSAVGRPITNPVTLREAVEREVVGCSLAALRMASHRGQLPEPVGVREMARLYDAEALRLWHLWRQ